MRKLSAAGMTVAALLAVQGCTYTPALPPDDDFEVKAKWARAFRAAAHRRPVDP